MFYLCVSNDSLFVDDETTPDVPRSSESTKVDHGDPSYLVHQNGWFTMENPSKMDDEQG